MKFLLKYFFGKKAPVADFPVPETDLTIINKGQCPDCGGSGGWTNCDQRSRIECKDCGSAFSVSPCSGIPFEYVYHVGYNREGSFAQHMKGKNERPQGQ